MSRSKRYRLVIWYSFLAAVSIFGAREGVRHDSGAMFLGCFVASVACLACIVDLCTIRE